MKYLKELSQNTRYLKSDRDNEGEDEEENDNDERDEKQDGDAEDGEEGLGIKALAVSKLTTRLASASPATSPILPNSAKIHGYLLEEKEDLAPGPLVSEQTTGVASGRPATTPLINSIPAELDHFGYSFSNNGSGDMYNQNVGNTVNANITDITNNPSKNHIYG